MIRQSKVRAAVVTVVKNIRLSFPAEPSYRPTQLRAGTFCLPALISLSPEFQRTRNAVPPTIVDPKDTDAFDPPASYSLESGPLPGEHGAETIGWAAQGHRNGFPICKRLGTVRCDESSIFEGTEGTIRWPLHPNIAPGKGLKAASQMKQQC